MQVRSFAVVLKGGSSSSLCGAAGAAVVVTIFTVRTTEASSPQGFPP